MRVGSRATRHRRGAPARDFRSTMRRVHLDYGPCEAPATNSASPDAHEMSCPAIRVNRGYSERGTHGLPERFERQSFRQRINGLDEWKVLRVFRREDIVRMRDLRVAAEPVDCAADKSQRTFR